MNSDQAPTPDHRADASRWARISGLLDEVLELDSAARAKYVSARCAGDSALEEEVLQFLAMMDASADFLEGGVMGGSVGDLSDEPAGSAIGQVLGAWKISALIGRGGMGEVYRADRIDGQFEQQVAIKLIRSDIAVSTPRFLLERQIVASLQHPGIARLLDGGVAPDGRPYMVMEYVEGPSLRSYCARADLDLEARLSLFRQIGEAVAFAHRHLVVHRDLKPDNVRIDGEGRARLLDFGIAKLIDRNAGSAVQTQMLLTPDSAAPELLTGGTVTAATDVYGLGLILHELLTGDPPRRIGHAALAVSVREILESELPLPSSRSRLFAAASLRGDLDAITAHALRRDPDQRYPNAEALLDDLQRRAEGRAVLARGDSGGYLVSRYLRRHRFAVAAAFAVLFSLAVGAVGIAWQAREAAIQRDRALAEASRSKAVSDYLMHMFRIAGEDSEGQDVSARVVLEKAASRVRDEFSADPEAARETLLALGDLYFQIGDPEGAAPMFEQFLELSDESTDRGAVAVALQRLAEIRFDPAKPGASHTLLGRAQAIWAAEPERYGEALRNSRVIEAAFARETGHPETAAALLGPVAEKLDASGQDPATAAVVFNELGSAQAEAGQFHAALDSYARSLMLFERSGQAESSSAAIALNNRCGALHLAGRDDEAESCARRSAVLRLRLYGPSLNSAAVQLLLGQVLLGRGEPEAARRALQEGLDMARPFATPASGIVHRMRLTQVQALAEAGLLEQAESELDAIERSVSEHAVLGTRFRGLVLIERARLLMLRGEIEAARGLLQEAEALVSAPHANRQDDLYLWRVLQSSLAERP